MTLTQSFRMSSKLALTGAVLALGAMAAQAQTMPTTDPAPAAEPAVQQPNAPTAMSPADAFAKADVNTDGKLSREEAQAIAGLADKFDVSDADKDGALSQAEFGAALAQ